MQLQQTARRLGLNRAARTMMGIAFAALMVSLMLFTATSIAPQDVHAQEDKTADLIIQFDDGSTVIRTVEFSDAISGATALQQSGLDVVMEVSSFGTAICSIAGVGCNFPEESCFCQCTGEGPCRYWGYNIWDGDSWIPHPAGGVGSSVISKTGAIEGLRWGLAGADFTPPLLTTPATNAQAARSALTYLRSTQVVTEGGFGRPNASMEAAMAIGANREDAAGWSVTADSPTLAGYLMANGVSYAGENAAAAGKVAISSASTNACQPGGFPAPATYYDASLGAYSEHNGFNAWAILGALAVGDKVPDAAVQALRDTQKPNGGWEWMETFGTDSNTTSLAIQALVGTGQSVTSTEVISGLAFLKSAQNADGGITYQPNSAFNTDSDANSTAYAVQAIGAAGQNPMDPAWTSGAGKTPIDYLLDLQLSDGSFEWQPGTGTNLLATQQAIPALLGNPYPNGAGLEICDATYMPIVLAP
jgi:hypothetical protein